MKKADFYNNIAFRLSAPILIGVMMYILILMAFDSIGGLYENFFSGEFLFVLIVTISVLELNRLAILIFKNRLQKREDFLKFAIIQVLTASIFTFIAVSVLLYAYFINFVGFTTITTELWTFNSLFLIAMLFFQIYVISLKGFSVKNHDLINYETERKHKNELLLQSYKDAIKPNFLLEALEIVIVMLHNDKKAADDIVIHLSQLYRYTLTEEKTELRPITEECNALLKMISILNHKQPIVPDFDVKSGEGKLIVPGVLFVLFEEALVRNLAFAEKPLEFNVSCRELSIEISYNRNERLNLNCDAGKQKNQMNKIYDYYKPGSWQNIIDPEKVKYILPVLTIDEEE